MTAEGMNHKERLIRILNKQAIDRPAFICPGGMMNMAVTEVMESLKCYWPEAHTDPVKMAKLALGTSQLTGIENLGLPFCLTVEAEAMGAAVDLGSTGVEPIIIAYAIERMSDMERLGTIDVSQGRARTCVEAIRFLKQQQVNLPIIANLSGPASLAASLVDPLIYYRAMRRDKAAVHRLNRVVIENIITFGNALIEAGADVVCISDPSATGELIGRNSFEEFVLPGLNEITQHFRDTYNTPAIVHICGDVKCLGSALNMLTAEAISIDSVVAIKTLKELAPDKIAMGNVSTSLLEQGREDELFHAGLACVSKGVDILAPACGLSSKTPVKNIKQLADSVMKNQETCCYG